MIRAIIIGQTNIFKLFLSLLLWHSFRRDGLDTNVKIVPMTQARLHHSSSHCSQHPACILTSPQGGQKA
ncbi:Uncharacterized protein HZ326_2563 [Fusarium oxysporum f. sp. albedinis]|nr:Uncharacterized protein HZ326_2563 [Fusarium oxysporum f. sp. albedinis]